MWRKVTPRTHMFRRLFAFLDPSSGPVDMMVAMHQCGFTAHVLETLPEAILVPLQDVILACQPNPSPSWNVGLLALVKRPDIGSLLRPVKMWRGLGSDVTVSLLIRSCASCRVAADPRTRCHLIMRDGTITSYALTSRILTTTT